MNSVYLPRFHFLMNSLVHVRSLWAMYFKKISLILWTDCLDWLSMRQHKWLFCSGRGQTTNTEASSGCSTGELTLTTWYDILLPQELVLIAAGVRWSWCCKYGLNVREISAYLITSFHSRASPRLDEKKQRVDVAQIVKHPLQSCLYTNRGPHVCCHLYINGWSIPCKVIVVNNIFQRLFLECCDYDVLYLCTFRKVGMSSFYVLLCLEYFSSINFLKLQEETKTKNGKMEIKRSNA